MRKTRKILIAAVLIVFLLALLSVLVSALSTGELQKYALSNDGEIQVAGDIEFTQEGNVITVTHDHACKVGYLDGEEYKNICANANDDGSYSFKFPDDVTNVIIVVSGDVNFDGRVTAADVARLNAHIIGKNTIGADALFAGDVDGDGNEIVEDLSKMIDDILRRNPLEPIRHNYSNGVCNICGDISGTAPTTHTVMFVDYDGTVLSTQSVADGGNATIPSAPTKAGATFLGWSGDYINVSQNEIVTAIYDDVKNVFVVESVSGSVGDTVTVLVSVDGAVKTCGFDFTLYYDNSVLEIVSYDSDLDLDVVANAEAIDNGVILNFIDANDKTKSREIISITFSIKDTDEDISSVYIEMTSIKEIDGTAIVNSTYEIVAGTVTLQ